MSSRTLSVAVAVSANHGRVGKLVSQRLEVAVVGPEVVAPLRNAVGFVDGDKARLYGVQKVNEPWYHQAFRRDVEDVQAAVICVHLHAADFGLRHGAVDESGPDALGPERVDLVFHQGDQRRDYQGYAVEQHRRKLVADGLATARRHEHQRIAPGEHVPDDVFLVGQKSIVPKALFEQAR